MIPNNLICNPNIFLWLLRFKKFIEYLSKYNISNNTKMYGLEHDGGNIFHHVLLLMYTKAEVPMIYYACKKMSSHSRNNVTEHAHILYVNLSSNVYLTKQY